MLAEIESTQQLCCILTEEIMQNTELKCKMFAGLLYEKRYLQESQSDRCHKFAEPFLISVYSVCEVPRKIESLIEVREQGVEICITLAFCQSLSTKFIKVNHEISKQRSVYNI